MSYSPIEFEAILLHLRRLLIFPMFKAFARDAS